ncbi:S8 family serine peptidase [Propylenella binzhouense]|uniref:Peptidase S8/S53 domain-containing protein n=1 Tax=Propylenella binzhouense TaxID=2555902 RepID=A0A964WTX0_9HYPH|nr:S8 family serine peptidase [Propylenella binzhouense]MYZ48441.1 hypothetical protein [Propylenella binzhouense]
MRHTGTGWPSGAKPLLRVLAGLLLVSVLAHPAFAADPERLLLDAGQRICQGGVGVPPTGDAALSDEDRFRLRQAVGWSRTWQVGARASVKVTGIRRGPESPALFFLDYYEEGRPLVRAVVSSACKVLGGRRVLYGADGGSRPSAIERLDPALQAQGAPEPLNPPVPPGPAGGACVRVAILDNGVNYLRPDILARLARDGEGRLVGHDFWDGDDRPFDYGIPPGSKDPQVSAFSPRRHGSMVAGIFLKDAPASACIVPYRYFPQDPDRRIGSIVARASADGVRIVSISSGRSRPWPDFEAAIRRHPDILFVVAAGNEGEDLDDRPSYPAAYREANVLVVAASDAAGALWRGSNRGTGTVDLAVHATELAGNDFTGKPMPLTGTSFAAPRVSAVASAILAREPGLGAADLRKRILALAAATGVAADGIPVLTDGAIAAAVR